MAHGGKFTTDALEARFPEPEVIPETALWVLVKGDGICVSAGDVPAIFSGKNPEIAGIPVEHIQYLGHWGPIACYAAELRADAAMPAGLEYSGVRELFGRIPEIDLAIAAFAVRMIDFDRTTKFCGRCGAATRQLRTERSKTCTACNLITYPRLSPAIIVLVVRDDGVGFEPVAARMHSRIIWVMGNHDERAPFASILLGEEPSDAPQDRTDAPPALPLRRRSVGRTLGTH